MTFGILEWKDNKDPGGIGVGNNCGVDMARNIFFLCYEAGGLFTYKSTENGILVPKSNFHRSGLSLGVAIDYTRSFAFEAANIWTGIQPRGGVQSYSYTDDGILNFLSWNDAINPPGPFDPPYPVAKGIDIDIEWSIIFLAMSSSRGLNLFKYNDVATTTWKSWHNPGGNSYGVCVDTVNKRVFLFTLGGGIFIYAYDENCVLTPKYNIHMPNAIEKSGVVDSNKLKLFVSDGNRELDVFSYTTDGLPTHIGNYDTGFGDGGYGIDIDTFSQIISLPNGLVGIYIYKYDDDGACVHVDDDHQGGTAFGAKFNTLSHLIFLANWDRGAESYLYTFKPPPEPSVELCRQVSPNEVKDIELTIDTHDVFTCNNDLVVIDGVDNLRQRLKIKMLFFFEEWFLDTTKGIKYYESILIKNPDINLIENIYKAAIIEEEEITSLEEFQVNYDITQRKLDVSFRANSIYGDLEFIEEFTI